MRTLLLSSFICLAACGGNKAQPPQKKQEPTKSIPTVVAVSQPTSTSKPAAALSVPTTTSQPASTSAPTSTLASTGPQLVVPSGPPKVEAGDNDFDYDTWLGIKGFPAISEDGKLMAEISACCFDERDNIGDTVSFSVSYTADDKTKEEVELLSASESFIEDEEDLKNTQKTLAATVKPRVEAAQKILSGIKWVTLTEIPESMVEFDSEKLRLIVTVDGKKVVDKKHPEWKAPKTAPCKENEYGTGCGCDYPVLYMGGLQNSVLRTLVLWFDYEETHQCEDPPDAFSFTVQY